MPKQRDDESHAPPIDVEAEQGLLGTILANNGAYEPVSEFLKPEHFADTLLGNIYYVCATLIERNQTADPTTLKQFFESDEAYRKNGSPDFLAELRDAAPKEITAELYGRRILDLHLRRELIELGNDIVVDAYDDELVFTPVEQIEVAVENLFSLWASVADPGGFRLIPEYLKPILELAQSTTHRESPIGHTTGFAKLDLLLDGLRPSELTVLAGRPFMGASDLAISIAVNIVERHREAELESGDQVTEFDATVGFYSLAKSGAQLATDIIGHVIQIPSERLLRGELNEKESEKLILASQQFEKVKFLVDDTQVMSVSLLRKRAQRLKRQHGLALIVVDYLQLLRSRRSRCNEDNFEKSHFICQDLKKVAHDLRVPVLVVSHLPNEIDCREDKRPRLSDLHEMGAIEMVADNVLLLHREEHYLERSEPMQRKEESDDQFFQRHDLWSRAMEVAANKVEVIIAKQRNGPTGTIELGYRSDSGSFTVLNDEN